MSAAPAKPLKIFVVEDSKVVRLRLITALSSLPDVQIVGAAEDAGPAVVGIQEQRPHVVCLDLQLANSSGFEVLEQIRFIKPPPLVIVLTNHASPPYRHKCLQSGAHLFFDKATEFDLFLAAIEKVNASAETTPPGHPPQHPTEGVTEKGANRKVATSRDPVCHRGQWPGISTGGPVFLAAGGRLKPAPTKGQIRGEQNRLWGQ